MTKISKHSKWTIFMLVIAIAIIFLSACGKQSISKHVEEMGSKDSHLQTADNCLTGLLIIGIGLAVLKIWKLVHKRSEKK